MKWIYLSPHLDDAVLSCGGLIWEQAQAHQQVEIWTICAGDPPAGELSPFAQLLHQRWNTGRDAVSIRRAEDQIACGKIGAKFRHFEIPDCIYRSDPQNGFLVVNQEVDLFGSLKNEDLNLANSFGQELAGLLPMDAQIVCPLTIGRHVDHRLTRTVAEMVFDSMLYYADYPYIQNPGTSVSDWLKDDAAYNLKISHDGLHAWQDAISSYKSQISTFWNSAEKMHASIESYWQSGGGRCLWKHPLPMG
jgi:LmbE family N-acetylglucosaminyl deacetylase